MATTVQTVEQGVGGMYSAHPFPRRNAFGVEKMNRDFLRNLEFLGLPPATLQGWRVLDAGCGTGELSCLLARQGAQVTAIDISEGSLAYARRCAAAQGVSIEFLAGSLLTYPFPEASFDLVVSHMVLHHTADPEQGIANLVRALKPGGLCMLRLFQFWGRFSPFAIGSLWKLWLVRALGGRTPEARVRFAERWVYREGEEVPHGLSKETYLYDDYGVPQVTHHTYGEVLRWLRTHQLEYLSSNPPMEFARLVRPFLDDDRPSVTRRGRWLRRVGRAGLAVLPMHRLGVMQRPTRVSRGFSQAVMVVTGGSNMISVLARKPGGPVALSDEPARA